MLSSFGYIKLFIVSPYVKFSLLLHRVERLHHLLLLLLSLGAHLYPRSEQVGLLGLERPRPLIVLLYLLHDLLALVLLYPLYPLDCFLAVPALEVFYLLSVAELLLLLLLDTHKFVVLLLSLVVDRLLPALLHLDHVHPHLLPVALLLYLLLVLLLPQFFRFKVLLPLSLLGQGLVPKEFVLPLLLQLLVQELDHLDLALLLGCLALDIQTLLLTTHLKLLPLLLGQPFSLLELSALLSNNPFLPPLDLLYLLLLLHSLDLRLHLSPLVLFLEPLPPLGILPLHFSLSAFYLLLLLLKYHLRLPLKLLLLPLRLLLPHLSLPPPLLLGQPRLFRLFLVLPVLLLLSQPLGLGLSLSCQPLLLVVFQLLFLGFALLPKKLRLSGLFPLTIFLEFVFVTLPDGLLLALQLQHLLDFLLL